MNVQQMMSAAAEAAAQRYGLLVEGWRALYQSALDRSDFGTPRQMLRITEEAYAMGHRFLDTERIEVQRATREIALEAHRATLAEIGAESADELADAASEHLSDAESYLTHEITIQIERDIAFLKQSLRKAYLQVAVASRAQGIAPKAALIQYRIGNAAELHFFFHNRGGQKWPSRKFIRGVWRHHLLAVYNEIVLMDLADHGFDRAEVRHLNPDAHSNGMQISMHTGSALPTYSEIRNEVFHPNSDAILGRAGE